MQTTQADAAVRTGEQIRGLMTAHRVTQAEVAETLGLSQTAVSRRLRGEIAFDVAELDKLSDRLGVTVELRREAAK